MSAAPESATRAAIGPRWNPRSFADSFERPFQSIRWLCAPLEIGRGRPIGILGLPGAGKNDFAQSVALGVAAGCEIFGRFQCTRGRVCHLTYDMAAPAVELRYRRLANGLALTPEDLEGQLVILAHPSITLCTEGNKAVNLYAELFGGFDLAIVDNIREAIPGVDENDSRFGRYVTMLGQAGALGACTTLYAHHSGKAMGNTSRGTTAITAASGAQWEITGERANPRKLSHVRAHDMSTGTKPDFYLVRSEAEPEEGDFDAGGYTSIIYTVQDENHGPNARAT